MFNHSGFKQSALKIILSLLFFIFSTQIFAVDKSGISLAHVNESSDKMKIEKQEAPDIFKNERKCMVNEQIIGRGIDNTKILQVMLKVRRDIFVPSEQKQYAYEDRPLPIGYGQTISQPYIVAYMTQKLDLKSGHKVLEIGTGSGYQAAILAEITKEVYTVEIIPELGNGAIIKIKRVKI
jgi:protein-L-isoaspartate(D-aspartate) O-methyltransferase